MRRGDERRTPCPLSHARRTFLARTLFLPNPTQLNSSSLRQHFTYSLTPLPAQSHHIRGGPAGLSLVGRPPVRPTKERTLAEDLRQMNDSKEESTSPTIANRKRRSRSTSQEDDQLPPGESPRVHPNRTRLPPISQIGAFNNNHKLALAPVQSNTLNGLSFYQLQSSQRTPSSTSSLDALASVASFSIQAHNPAPTTTNGHSSIHPNAGPSQHTQEELIFDLVSIPSISQRCVRLQAGMSGCGCFGRDGSPPVPLDHFRCLHLAPTPNQPPPTSMKSHTDCLQTRRINQLERLPVSARPGPTLNSPRGHPWLAR